MAAESLQADIDSIHRSATALLLNEGVYRDDGHFVHTSRSEAGISRLTITDYESAFHRDFSWDDKQGAYSRILRSNEAFINFVIEEPLDLKNSYTLLVPAHIKPNTMMHAACSIYGANMTSPERLVLSHNSLTINDLGAIALLHKLGF